MGVPVGTGERDERDEREERAIAARAARRVLTRALVSVTVLAAMAWASDFQPFYATLITGASIPVGLILLWWTWGAVRRSRRDRRAAERRQRARRAGIDVPDEVQGAHPARRE